MFKKSILVAAALSALAFNASAASVSNSFENGTSVSHTNTKIDGKQWSNYGLIKINAVSDTENPVDFDFTKVCPGGKCGDKPDLDGVQGSGSITIENGGSYAKIDGTSNSTATTTFCADSFGTDNLTAGKRFEQVDSSGVTNLDIVGKDWTKGTTYSYEYAAYDGANQNGSQAEGFGMQIKVENYGSRTKTETDQYSSFTNSKATSTSFVD